MRQPRTIQRRLHTNRQPARQLIHEAVLRRVFRPPQHNTSRQTRSMPTFQRSDKDLHKKAKAGAARAEVRQVRPGSRQGCAGCVIRYPNCYLVASQRPASAGPQRRHAATLHRRAPSPTLLAAQTGQHTAASNGAHARPGARREPSVLEQVQPELYAACNVVRAPAPASAAAALPQRLCAARRGVQAHHAVHACLGQRLAEHLRPCAPGQAAERVRMESATKRKQGGLTRAKEFFSHFLCCSGLASTNSLTCVRIFWKRLWPSSGAPWLLVAMALLACQRVGVTVAVSVWM